MITNWLHGILIFQDISYSLSFGPDFILILGKWKLSFFIIGYFFIIHIILCIIWKIMFKQLKFSTVY